MRSPLLIFFFFYCCLVAKLCPTLWDPMDSSIPGFPVLHYLPEFAQTHVHWVGDAIQPAHPLSSRSLPDCTFSVILRNSLSPRHTVLLSFTFSCFMFRLMTILSLSLISGVVCGWGLFFAVDVRLPQHCVVFLFGHTPPGQALNLGLGSESPES